ncbi:hypothetical protein ATZ33_03075 [Enterococcus silesiacus]|uniref:Transcriptional regulator n=1 Tax=Enterococcus silesiacus TaxID=332949 RepID=A0A0S3K7U1_9ENTE|nr:LysR family transcriptional regulator [Enterococcus silesiacus]ALS00390.1 hypothetical protein ATZ33_03075 [Enterococcus silesiacus]OJG85355.1 transcriptional regulator [Enterococcus silesiacus]
MDITQLVYFIKIVECDFNLTLAAEKVHITQSALSQVVSNFENGEGILLFTRKNGRLNELTPAGHVLYRYALEIVQKHQEMLKAIKNEANKLVGSVRIGIPPTLLRSYFIPFLPEFISHHKNIGIEIIEQSANELKALLLDNALDIAVLVQPAALNKNQFEEYSIRLGEYAAYMSIHHDLAELDKIDWSDLKGYPVGTFQKSLTSYHIVLKKLKHAFPKAKIQFTSTSWEYLLETTKDSNKIVIMPIMPKKSAKQNYFLQKKFKESLSFDIGLYRPLKSFYNPAEIILHGALIDFFNSGIMK